MGGGVPIDVIKALVDAAQVADADGVLITDKKGNPKPDSDLRDNENVPLPAISVQWEPDVADRLDTVEYRSAINDYLAAEVHPYVPDAWADYDKTKIGYEIPLTRHFYEYTPPRPLAEIDAEIKQLEAEIQELLREAAE
jgi:type I restriction enzyme M protein